MRVATEVGAGGLLGERDCFFDRQLAIHDAGDEFFVKRAVENRIVIWKRIGLWSGAEGAHGKAVHLHADIPLSIAEVDVDFDRGVLRVAVRRPAHPGRRLVRADR